MTKRAKRVKGEKFLFTVLVVLLIAIPLCDVSSKAMLSKTNIELESMKSKVNDQEKRNESLSMKINELASLDKVQSVASKLGLEYNNSNIKTVADAN